MVLWPWPLINKINTDDTGNNDENPSKIDLYGNVLTQTKSIQKQIYKNWVGKAIKKIIGFPIYIHGLIHPNVTMNLTALINGNR